MIEAMKLESVCINRFRSIESGELTNCGGFNVLIGKNNSGKSNIISAIHAFFTCIRDGNVVTLDPPIGKEIDFFRRKTQLPIEINLIFSLSLAERDVLIRDIVTDAPQMKNAVDGLDPSLRLSATISIAPPPRFFGFISKLALEDTVRFGAKHPDTERIVLSVGSEAASEIHYKLSNARKKIQNSEGLRNFLRQFDEEDWRRYRNEIETGTVRGSSFIHYALRRALPAFAEIDSEFAQTFQSITRESASYSDFERALQSLITRTTEEAEMAQKELLTNKISTFAGEESSVPNYVRNLLRKVSEMKVLYLRERRKPIGKEEAEQLLSLKVKRGGPEVLRNIQETVSALLGVQIDAFESGSPSPRGETIAEMDVDNFLVEVNGSGIREALRLVLDVEFQHPHILLVEEPEIHLHPALETSMMRYLKRISSGCQVFISTHSTNFLDTAEMKNVYLVSKPNSTRIQLLDFEEAETQIPKELGIRLSSLFMFDRLVFVEGSSDEAILREWASKLGVNLSQSNVGFIAMGGVRNFTHFAAEATLSFLAKRQVKMWFLLDRDERDDSEIARLREAFGENATIKVLERREVENYLINPRAIVEFIKSKKELSGNRNDEKLPTESDVGKMIAEGTEKLKQIAIDKRVAKILCNPVYPSLERIFDKKQEMTITKKVSDEINRMIELLEAAKNKAEEVYKEQSESVDSVWQSSKSAMVPGDLLLDMVCREYSVRFRKERDGARLAVLMRENEIDEEIKGIIHEIGS